MGFDDIVLDAEKLLTKAHDIVDKAQNIGDYHHVIWNNKVTRFDELVKFPIPFYHAFISIATNLEDLILLMSQPQSPETTRVIFGYTLPLHRPQERRSQYNELSVTVSHADIEKPGSRYFDSMRAIDDPITYFNSVAADILMTYADGNLIFGDTVEKDFYIRRIYSELINSSTFSKERLEAACDEMIRALRTSLDLMQELYGVSAEAMVREYAAILERVEARLFEDNPNLAHLQRGHRREIYDLSNKAAGHFKVSRRGIARDWGERERPTYGIKTAVSGKSAIDLLTQMAAPDAEWADFLPDIVDHIVEYHAEDIDKYKGMLEFDGKDFTPVSYTKPAIEDIIGQQDNVQRLGRLLYSFGEGNRIPNIVLRSRPGRGKTMSLRALADVHPDLRVVLIHHKYLNHLGTLIDKLAELPYQVAAYVDDMHFGLGFDVEEFKTKTCGVKNDWPPNFALVVAVNPEAYDDLPESMKARFGITLDYNKPFTLDEWKQIFEVTAREVGVEYWDGLWNEFFKVHGKKPNDVTYLNDQLSARVVRDFMIERKAINDVDFPPGLQRA